MEVRFIIKLVCSNAGSKWWEEDADRVDEEANQVLTLSFSHVTGDFHRQKDIFQALSLHDFNKILSNLQD